MIERSNRVTLSNKDQINSLINCTMCTVYIVKLSQCMEATVWMVKKSLLRSLTKNRSTNWYTFRCMTNTVWQCMCFNGRKRRVKKRMKFLNEKSDNKLSLLNWHITGTNKGHKNTQTIFLYIFFLIHTLS